MEFVFGTIMVIGVGYLLLMVLGLADTLELIDVDGALGLDAGMDGMGCALIAVFMAVFGAFGLTGVLLSWNLIGTILTAVALGFVMSRLGLVALRQLRKQESKPINFAHSDLIGRGAKITIASAPGKTGEALVEADTILKYPVREIDGAALQRGDRVAIVDVEGRFLIVRKIERA
ncbi:MAG: hypothetical protein SF123_09500 [Chloroflexota bacterium]|nr:hypothetical protein [Chloroflexota bacterium]